MVKAKKSSDAFREKMRGRKKALTRKGTVIDKKDWTKGRLRLLPCHGDDPAKEFKSFYVKEMKKSVTAPCTYGVEDPLWERLDSIYQTGEKAEKDHAKDYCNRSTEYWTPCIVRGDEGTAANPNVRIFRLPYKAYQYIVDLIVDEDYGEDITDADTGRDILLKKEGKGVNTEWKPDKMDPEPLVDDEDLYERLVELSHSFDQASHFFSFDLEDYIAAYEGLTNEEIPEEYMAALEALAEGDGEVEADDEEADEEAAEEEADDGDDDGDEEDADEAEGDMLEDPPEGIEFGATVVSFTVEDEDENEVEATGVVQSWGEDPDNEGEYLLVILGEDDDPEDPWMMDVDDVEIVEVEEEAEPDEEEAPEEAEPAVKRGKKKASKKKATKKAPAKKPMPRRPKAATQIRSKKAATKKPAAKKAPAKKAPVKKKATTKKKASKKTTRRGK